MTQELIKRSLAFRKISDEDGDESGDGDTEELGPGEVGDDPSEEEGDEDFGGMGMEEM